MRKLILLGFILISLMPFLLASEFGYNNPNLPNVPTPEVTVITFDNNTGAVNRSVYWDGLLTFNATQMENSNEKLNIKESWFTTLWNAIFGTKTTDDLTEGSTNLYETGDTYNATYVAINTSQNIQGLGFYNKSDLKTNNLGWITYTRTVNIKNVTMTAVI